MKETKAKAAGNLGVMSVTVARKEITKCSHPPPGRLHGTHLLFLGKALQNALWQLIEPKRLGIGLISRASAGRHSHRKGGRTPRGPGTTTANGTFTRFRIRSVKATEMRSARPSPRKGILYVGQGDSSHDLSRHISVGCHRRQSPVVARRPVEWTRIPQRANPESHARSRRGAAPDRREGTHSRCASPSTRPTSARDQACTPEPPPPLRGAGPGRSRGRLLVRTGAGPCLSRVRGRGRVLLRVRERTRERPSAQPHVVQHQQGRRHVRRGDLAPGDHVRDQLQRYPLAA
ncbi:hypothetical protein GA0115244_11964 [Streptomyces sp. DvalAA-19]|nr:hypothetical protein GA0115244_11964 [Streptomyces sp. DvalAA-19]